MFNYLTNMTDAEIAAVEYLPLYIMQTPFASSSAMG